MLRALRHRNFALFLGGQVCSLIGYWIQQIALAWLVYRLTGSATLLGMLAFASNLPVLLLAPFAGLWSDRFNRHRMMLATQVLEMLQAVALTALAFSGVIEIWHIIVLTMLLGMCVAIELPVRHAYLIELIGDKQDLANAVAVMSLVGNCGRLAGPVLAGLLIGWFSEATCFLINALTYIAVLASFAFIRVGPQPHAQTHAPALHGLKEGLVYAWRTVPIRFLLTLLALIALTAAPYNTLMPAVVHEAFAGNAETLGYLVGAAGMGAVCGTLLLASRRNVRGLVRFIVAAALVAGSSLIALSWSRWLALSLVLMGVDRLQHPGNLGRGQHNPADHRRRRQARPRDEPVYRRVSRRRAVRRLDCRRACRPHRRDQHPARRRHRLRAGRAVYDASASAAAPASAADLRAARHHSRRSGFASRRGVIIPASHPKP